MKLREVLRKGAFFMDIFQKWHPPPHPQPRKENTHSKFCIRETLNLLAWAENSTTDAKQMKTVEWGIKWKQAVENG